MQLSQALHAYFLMVAALENKFVLSIDSVWQPASWQRLLYLCTATAHQHAFALSIRQQL